MRWIVAAFVLAGVLWWVGLNDGAAMRACRERHSFDTCHYAIHR